MWYLYPSDTHPSFLIESESAGALGMWTLSVWSPFGGAVSMNDDLDQYILKEVILKENILKGVSEEKQHVK